MITPSLKPIKYKDHRTYDFHRTFGTIEQIPEEFNFDQTGAMPDQNAEGLPQGCTAFTVTDMASNNDKRNYTDKRYTYEKTKMMMGVKGEVPVDQMTSMKSATIYGVKAKERPEEEALNNRQGPYFIVKRLNDSYFDGLVSAMWKKQGTLSVGTVWLGVFDYVKPNGVIPGFTPPQNFEVGHNWEACGVKVVEGERRIICKSWQGKNWGDGGYCYFSRKQIDDLLSIKGSGAFGQKSIEPGDIVRVKMTIIEQIISYIKQIIIKLFP